jgi:uncharacterized membrane protein YgcG
VWERSSNLRQLDSVKKENFRYGKYEMLIINGRKCVKKETEYMKDYRFTNAVQNKDKRKTFDPAFFSELIDFESGKFDPSSRRRSSRRRRRSSRSSRTSSRSEKSSVTSNTSSGSGGSSSRKRRRLRRYRGDKKHKPNFWVIR